MEHRLLEAPVNAQAILLPLHAPFALAAVQGRGLQRRHSALALAAGAGAQLHTAVAGYTLPQGSQSRTTCVVGRASVAGLQAVQAAATRSCHQGESFGRR